MKRHLKPFGRAANISYRKKGTDNAQSILTGRGPLYSFKSELDEAFDVGQIKEYDEIARHYDLFTKNQIRK